MSEGDESPRIERNSSIWKRVSWNNTSGRSFSTARANNNDEDERVFLIRLMNVANGVKEATAGWF